MAEYRVKQAKDGSYFYELVADNGEVLSVSEMFISYEHAQRGVEDAEKAAAEATPPEAA